MDKYKEKMGMEGERRKHERIKDLHSKANSTRERGFSAEETVCVMKTERTEGGSAQVALTNYKTQLCLESCGSESQSDANH